MTKVLFTVEMANATFAEARARSIELGAWFDGYCHRHGNTSVGLMHWDADELLRETGAGEFVEANRIARLAASEIGQGSSTDAGGYTIVRTDREIRLIIKRNLTAIDAINKALALRPVA